MLGRLLGRWNANQRLGRRGERVAARHLKRQGYRILARNLRNRLGEIDLLAEADDRRTLVIVEVKSGTNDAIAPEQHVTAAKQRKLTALAASLMRRHRLTDRPVRFDVVAVTFPPRGKRVLRHHVGAFASHV